VILRNYDTFNFIVNNYWQYYLELEKEFLQTRRYVEFSKQNLQTYSVEYLKLYQAVCSEIDVIGKAMAKVANSSFVPEDKKNNIRKWWYEIQDVFFLMEAPFTDINQSDCSTTFGLTVYKCKIADGLEIAPWSKYRIEKYRDKKNRLGYRLEDKAETPSWWNDYNLVKHNRTSIVQNDSSITNYSKANLGNLCSAFAALYILEKAFMDTVGTEDDLSSFIDFSKLFIKRRRYTYDEMDRLMKVQCSLPMSRGN